MASQGPQILTGRYKQPYCLPINDGAELFGQVSSLGCTFSLSHTHSLLVHPSRSLRLRRGDSDEQSEKQPSDATV